MKWSNNAKSIRFNSLKSVMTPSKRKGAGNLPFIGLKAKVPKLSGNCNRKKHWQCYSLGCTCTCHKGGIA